MSSRTAEVLMWAQRVVRTKGNPPHELLEIPANATAEQAQEAFHKIARTAHPDLHRQGMTAEELEVLTSAYATVAGAYQAYRAQTQRIRMPVAVGPPQRAATPPPVADPEPVPPPPNSPLGRAQAAQAGPPRQRPKTSPPVAPRTAPIPTQPRTAPIPTQPRTAPIPTQQPRTAPIPTQQPRTAAAPASATGSAQQVSPKALVYYRKAQLCLQRGDLKGAILQLKLACAADPQSSFLRSALAEVQAELAKS